MARMGRSLTGRGMGTDDEIVFEEDELVIGSPTWRPNPFTEASDDKDDGSMTVGTGSKGSPSGTSSGSSKGSPSGAPSGVGVMEMLPMIAVVGGGILAAILLFKK